MTELEIDNELARLRPQLNQISNRINQLSSQRARLVEQRERQLIESGKADFAYLLDTENGDTSMTRYRAAQQAMNELGIALGMGSLRDTGQRIVQVCFGNRYGDVKTVDNQLEAINTLLPHLKRSDLVGGIYIDLFEPTLSEHGIFFIVIVADDQVELRKTTYGTTRTLQTFDSLRACFAYCAINHAFDLQDDD